MLNTWLKCAAAVAFAAACAAAQTKSAAPLTTPAAILTKIDDKSAQVVYHNRDDKVFVVDFVLNSRTDQPRLKKNDVVLVTYVDRGAEHIAKSIRVYALNKPYPFPSSPGGGVGGVATNTVPVLAQPPQPAQGKELAAIYTQTTPYSIEGALAMRSAIYHLLVHDDPERERRPHSIAAPVYVLTDDLAFTANDYSCTAVNIVGADGIHRSCQRESGEIVSNSADWIHTALKVDSGTKAYLDRISVKAYGVSLSMRYTQHNRAYKSTLLIPFRDGELPTEATLQDRLLQVIEARVPSSEPADTKSADKPH